MRGIARCWKQPAQARHRTEHTHYLQGRGTPSSRQHKLAQKRSAAEGSRIGSRSLGGGRNLTHPWDFEVRGRRRASGKSQMAERRASVNRSPCGRRTSLCRGQSEICLPTPPVYPHLTDASSATSADDSMAYQKTASLKGCGLSERRKKQAPHPPQCREPPESGESATCDVP